MEILREYAGLIQNFDKQLRQGLALTHVSYDGYQ